MAARGFTGSIRSYQDYRMRPVDWFVLAITIGVAAVAVLASRSLP
jgi:energy-coupling factor transporter transmembrane protein EcfT